MDENLKRLTRELRSVKCPPEVLARVHREIDREKSPSSRPRLAVLAVAAAALVLTAILVLQRGAAPNPEETAMPGNMTQADAQRVIDETQISLAYIGAALIKAGDHSEAVISKQIMPPLRGGFEKAAKTILNQMKL